MGAERADVAGVAVEFCCILIGTLTGEREGDQMRRLGLHDQIKMAFQDIIAPEIRELRGEMLRLDQEIDGVRSEVVSLRAEILAEIRRLDTRIDAVDARIEGVDARIDGLERDVRTAIDVRERLAALEARRST